MPSARFDDLRPRRRRSFALGEIERVLEAHEIGEVVDVLAEAEREVAPGTMGGRIRLLRGGPRLRSRHEGRPIARRRSCRWPGSRCPGPAGRPAPLRQWPLLARALAEPAFEG